MSSDRCYVLLGLTLVWQVVIGYHLLFSLISPPLVSLNKAILWSTEPYLTLMAIFGIPFWAVIVLLVQFRSTHIARRLSVLPRSTLETLCPSQARFDGSLGSHSMGAGRWKWRGRAWHGIPSQFVVSKQSSIFAKISRLAWALGILMFVGHWKCRLEHHLESK